MIPAAPETGTLQLNIAESSAANMRQVLAHPGLGSAQSERTGGQSWHHNRIRRGCVPGSHIGFIRTGYIKTPREVARSTNDRPWAHFWTGFTTAT
jgi:hypothetical protein